MGPKIELNSSLNSFIPYVDTLHRTAVAQSSWLANAINYLVNKMSQVVVAEGHDDTRCKNLQCYITKNNLGKEQLGKILSTN